MPHMHSSSCGTNPIFPTAHSIARPAAPDGVRPIIATPHLPRPPSRPTAPSARRIYLALSARRRTCDTSQPRHLLGAARPLLNRNSTKYVQHRICALQSTPREACSNTISLAMREMLGVAVECPAHPPSTIQSLSGRAPRPKLPKIKRRELAPATIFSSTAVRTAEWCFFRRPRRLLHGPRCRCSIRRAPRPAAPLAARGATYNATTARAIRYRRALPFLLPPRARHHAGANTSPTALPAARAARAARDVGVPHRRRRLVAFPHTVTLHQCTAVTDRRLRLPYSPAPPSSPPACAARAMVVPHPRRRFYRLLACQMHLQQVPLSPIHTRAGRLYARPLCPAPAAAAPHPPRHSYHLPARRYRVQRLIILRSKPARVRHREYDAQHRRSTQQVQCAFPVAHAAFTASPGTAPIFCADASDRSKPWPAAHRE
ncbi:hypothetical protein B0H14DRAFT_3886690 [Mycena olivaceomarginata]|nr:hypothetical protein B0H14DRAFT_3886690 [Mycena olivaceomarginata]